MKTIKFFLLLLLFFFSYQKVNSQINIDADYVILQDYHSGKILYENQADDSIYPASMTKIMTAIVAFDLIKKGETTLDELITAFRNLWDNLNFKIHSENQDYRRIKKEQNKTSTQETKGKRQNNQNARLV